LDAKDIITLPLVLLFTTKYFSKVISWFTTSQQT